MDLQPLAVETLREISQADRRPVADILDVGRRLAVAVSADVEDGQHPDAADVAVVDIVVDTAVAVGRSHIESLD